MRRKSKYELQHELMKVHCRLAILRDDALRCEFAYCRRARTCMGEHFNCVFKPHDPAKRISANDVNTWNALACQRQELLDAIKRLQPA